MMSFGSEDASVALLSALLGGPGAADAAAATTVAPTACGDAERFWDPLLPTVDAGASLDLMLSEAAWIDLFLSSSLLISSAVP
jgi:hypothetical protein